MQNRATEPGAGFVYVQTNEPERNRVLAFRRAGDGTLTPAGGYETGGAGDGKPHLTSQGSVVLTGDGRYLLVTNAASGDLSVFAVGPDGLTLLETVRTGRAPKSAAEHAGLVYVLNTGEPSLAGFRLSGAQVQALVGSARELAAGTDPAQVGFSPDGATLVVTQRGTNAIAIYLVAETGQLGQPLVQPSPGPTPYGFAFTGRGGLVVTEAFGAQAGKAAVSSYRITMMARLPSRVRSATAAARSAGRWSPTTVATPSPPTSATGPSRDTRSAMTAASCSTRLRPGSRSRGKPVFATRISAGTAGSCTRSTPTTSVYSAGPSARAGHYRRPGRGRDCPRPWPASRPAEATRPKPLAP
jgi:6-phosphogluconolactonase (cycloisomerase 2 family)